MAANIRLLKFNSCRDCQNPGWTRKFSTHSHLCFQKSEDLGTEGPGKWSNEGKPTHLLGCCRHLSPATGLAWSSDFAQWTGCVRVHWINKTSQMLLYFANEQNEQWGICKGVLDWALIFHSIMWSTAICSYLSGAENED